MDRYGLPKPFRRLYVVSFFPGVISLVSRGSYTDRRGVASPVPKLGIYLISCHHKWSVQRFPGIRDSDSDNLPVHSIDHLREFGPADSTIRDHADDQQGSRMKLRIAGISWSRFGDLDALTKFEQALNMGQSEHGT